MRQLIAIVACTAGMLTCGAQQSEACFFGCFGSCFRPTTCCYAPTTGCCPTTTYYAPTTSFYGAYTSYYAPSCCPTACGTCNTCGYGCATGCSTGNCVGGDCSVGGNIDSSSARRAVQRRIPVARMTEPVQSTTVTPIQPVLVRTSAVSNGWEPIPTSR